jgi:hypothetical protein
MPKLNLSEHVNALFEGVNVSEEQKTKVETIFESAVGSILEEEKSKLEAEVESKVSSLAEEYAKNQDQVIKKYLEYVIKEWRDENQVAIESGVKVELAESLFNGMKTLMTEHNVVMPEDGVDIVKEQQSEIDKLKESVNELKSKELELVEEITIRDKEKALTEAAAGLSETQKEKFIKLSEKIEFKQLDTYQESLKIIRESYFKESQEGSEDNSGKKNINESVDPTDRMAQLLNVYSN